MVERAPDISSVRLLGPVQALASDGSVIDLPSATQRRLLGILALHAPRRVRAEWLADLLGISTGALRTSVSRLRSAIGSGALQTVSTGYTLVADVDATQFCEAVAVAASSDDRIGALQRALTLWIGPVLEEFRGEEWADGEIARLSEVHAGTVDEYAGELITARRSGDAVALLESQIGLHPYRDRSRGLLIRALASVGRQGEALRAFQRYRSLLIEEIGTEPSPEVVRIERRVATGWDGFESEPDSPNSPDSADLPDSPNSKNVVSIPLPGMLAHDVLPIGRADELDVLVSEIALARTSGLRCVLLTGESGIGKTTLLTAFARTIVSAATATVLYGRCDETGVPLEPFRSILGACVEHAPEDVLIEHVARCGGELMRLAPILAARVTTTPPPTDSDDATERFLAFGAAADLLRRIAARGPVVVMLDDLQWAEPTALLLLRHLHRALTAAPVVLVSSTRDPGEHPPDELRLALADLGRGASRPLHLAGLVEADLEDLVSSATKATSGPETHHAAKVLLAETAGNPLYASQLVRHWAESGSLDRSSDRLPALSTLNTDDLPPSLRHVIWRRVHSLGDDASNVLAAAAVLGVEFHEDVLVDVADQPEPVVTEALDAAAAAGLLYDLGSVRRSMRFVHPLVTGALYAELGRSSLARLHSRAARTLEKGVAALPPAVVVQLARHCALGGLAAEAQHWSICAGDHALEQLAPIEASHHYQVALDMAIALDRPVAERANLLVRLGDAQHRSGDAAALSTLEQGAELARQRGRGTLSSGRRSPVTAVSCVASITIYWSPPTSDGGSAITGYNVYESTTSGGESTTPCNSSPLPSSTGKFTVTGLKSGKKYYFEVKAINAVGTGAASKQAATTPAATSSILRVGHDTPRLGVLSLTRYWATRTGFVVAWGRRP